MMLLSPTNSTALLALYILFSVAAVVASSCTQDSDCALGACGRSEALEDSPFVCCASGQVSFESFSLRNVCTGLSSGAACNSNNNLCASGICGDDNLCLDEKLAAGESCRDDNMCASGACGRSEALEDSPFVCCASGETSWEGYSLSLVCTDLPSDAACIGNNNLCASGVCGDDNLCLDEKLATAEVCRDSNMCALGACGRSEALADAPNVCCSSGETSWAGSGPGDVCTDLPSGAVCNGNNNLCASGICGNIPGSTSVYTCQPNQTAGSNPTSTSGSASQPNQTAATASSNPTSTSGSASQPNQTAGSNPMSTSGSVSQPNQSAQATVSSSTSVAVAYCPTLFFLVQIVIFVAAR